MFSKLFPISIYQISGNSMNPLLKNDQKVIGINWFFKIKEDDVVVIKYKNKMIIKRIKKVNKDQIWIEGDNQKESTDSRTFGWINKSAIIAKIYLV